MPELPEVQTIVSGLQKKVCGKKIQSIIEKRIGTLVYEEDLKICEYGIIEKISRRGKYVILETSEDIKINVHLRMTGKLIFEKNLDKTSSHSRAEIIFSDLTKLIFDDVRTFGKIKFFKKKEDKSIQKLGVEPLDTSFNADYLKRKIKNRKIPVKTFLLDQHVIAGLGNIYVAEILYDSGIMPDKKVNTLSEKNFEEIVNNTKIILKKAIKCNGTTISDYRSVEDKTGEFQNFLKVYQKEYCPQNHKIQKIKIAGRVSYFCPKCQKK